MPTGYTNDIYEGKPITFPEFAMKCARAFGALIMLRDEPMDAPIPDAFLPSDYHVKALAEAKDDLALALEWTDAEAASEADHANTKAAEYHARRVAESAAMATRYDAMIAEVEKWAAPTDDHVEFRNFMLKQLTDSRKWDCGVGEPPAPMTAATYRADRIAHFAHMVEYHTKEHAQEVERAQQRTAWVKALRDSLNAPASAEQPHREDAAC